MKKLLVFFVGITLSLSGHSMVDLTSMAGGLDPSQLAGILGNNNAGGGGGGLGGVLSNILPGSGGRSNDNSSRADHIRACERVPHDAHWDGKRCQCFNQQSRWTMSGCPGNAVGCCVARRGGQDAMPDDEATALSTAAGLRGLDFFRERPSGSEVQFVTGVNEATDKFVIDIAGKPPRDRRGERALARSERTIGNIAGGHDNVARRAVRDAEAAVRIAGAVERFFSGNFASSLPRPDATLSIVRGAHNDARRALDTAVRESNRAGEAIVRAERARDDAVSANRRGQTSATRTAQSQADAAIREAREASRAASRAATEAERARDRAITAEEEYFRARTQSEEWIAKQRESLRKNVGDAKEESGRAHDEITEFMDTNRNDLPRNLETSGDGLLTDARRNRTSADGLPNIDDRTPAAADFPDIERRIAPINRETNRITEASRGLLENFAEHQEGVERERQAEAERLATAEREREEANASTSDTSSTAVATGGATGSATAEGNPNDEAAKRTLAIDLPQTG